jgi:polygalacturonase
MCARDVPVADRKFGEGAYLRPSFIETVRGANILIEGVTITNSPMFDVHPLYCSNVTVHGIKTVSHGPNNDGCDPDSCTDVLIENCVFDTGDDCIAIKSGRNQDGRRVAAPSANIVIRNCRVKDGHGGLTIGSEMSGGVRNVFAEKCQLDSPNLNEAIRLKTNAMRGGVIENVSFRDIRIGRISDAALQIDFYYEEGPDGPERPAVRGIDVRGLTCQKAKYALNLRGFPNAHISGLRLERCEFGQVSNPNVLENVDNLVLKEVTINGRREDT